MALAALLFFPLGTLVARSANLSKERHLGTRSFKAHLALQVSGFALFIGGLVVAFLMVEGGCHFWTGSGNLLHGVLGIVVAVLLVVQVALGAMRPSKQSDVRQRWAMLHKLLGHGLAAIMMVNCLLGAIKWLREDAIFPLIAVASVAALWQLAFLGLQAKSCGNQSTREVPSDPPAGAPSFAMAPI